MLDWIDFFFKASILCGLLTIYLLLFKKNALRSFSDYLLSAFILCQCWTILLFILVYSENILDYPHLYKSAAPLTFLIAPLGYFYVRSVLFNEVAFKKIDLLHALPFLFVTLNYLPFFASSTVDKLGVLTATIEDKNIAITTQLGLLPEIVFYIALRIQAFIYLLFQWALLLQFNKAFKVKEVEQQVTVVTRWLKVYTLANSAILFSLIFVIILYFWHQSLLEEGQMSQVPNYLLSFSFFVICTYLLVNPQVLNGLPFVKYTKKKSELLSDELVNVPFIQKNYTKEIAQLEAYFTTPNYIQPNLTISEVAVATQIPIRELSFLINSFYKQRFNDYLNDMRLSHFLTKMDLATLDIFTIETIALASGFSSKSSFYRAFKKRYKNTPTTYLQALHPN
jgi:AraC-like DNA-binding protein